jgi:folate-binding protein YgfZ
MMGACVLADRGIVRVAGAGARAFLQGLVTCDMDKVSETDAAYGALLSPQGKILFDFFIAQKGGDDFWIDTPAALAGDLCKRLGFYRLRAKLVIENKSDDHDGMKLAAFWDGAKPPQTAMLGFVDPRHPRLGTRSFMPAFPVGILADSESYEAHRIRLGVPKGGVDFAYGESFPHEANLDRLHGVDFKKGCYVGQEVVSRVEHRGTARKRLVPVTFAGGALAPGTPVTAGETVLGSMGSSIAGAGLAMLRLDKVEDARAAGLAVHAGATALTL